jgi:cathepsin L
MLAALRNFVGSLIVVVALCGALSHGAQTSTKSAPVAPHVVHHTRAELVNDLALKLLHLDSEVRKQFNKEHPNTLPDTMLSLPKPTASAFDWCNLNKVSEHHRQRNEDCWANAAVEALECSYLIRNNRRVTLSVQPLLDHLRLGSEHMAGSSSTACDFLLKHGTATSRDYPYTGKPAKPAETPTVYRACAWGYVSPDGSPPTRAQIKESLLQHGPLAISLLATKKFHAYQGGLFNEPDAATDDKAVTNHVVLLVGWDESRGKQGAWKIKNTWGTGWGEQGFMWIAHGSNNVCHTAYWIRALSTWYKFPSEEFHKLLPDAAPLPHLHLTKPTSTTPTTPTPSTTPAPPKPGK